MKMLQKPWVSGGLMVIALAVLLYQMGPHIGLRSRTGSAPRNSQTPLPAPAASAITTAPAPAAAPRTGPASVAQVPMERAYIQEHLAEWVDAPKRDPFLLLSDNTSGAMFAMNQSPSPVAQWKLRAIWRQTGGRLAVINTNLYREGDLLQGYRVERIDEDQVVLRGTNGTERLRFPRRIEQPKPRPNDDLKVPVSTSERQTMARTSVTGSPGRTNLYFQP